jgi:RHS repeat-associated protein
VLAKAQVGTSSPMTYANTPSGPLAQKVTSGKTTTVRYYLRDPHGDVVGVSDTSGALKGTALYDPWGQILSGTGELGTLPVQGGFRFQSDLMDASTGQLDMGARWYEPSLGRFSTPDPLMGQLTSPLSLNRYLYGLASPLTYTDPTGLSVRPTSGGGGHCGRGCQAQVQEMSQQTWDNAITAALAAAAAAIPDVPYLVITRKQMYGEPLLLHDYAGTSVLEALSRTMRGTGEILTAGGDFVAEVSSDVGLVVLVVCRGCEELAPLLGLISAGGKAVAAVGNALRGRWKEAVADTGFAALGLATGGVGPLYARLGELTGGLSKAEEVGIRVLQFVLETMQKAVELKVGYGFWQEGPST